MKKILLLNKISSSGLNLFNKEAYQLGDNIDNPDAILVRSASMHELTVNNNLLAVARAGAGVNNIPVESYTEKGIVVFNTPGANANSVKELTLAALLLSARNIVAGIQWVSNLNCDNIAKTVEKEKGAFEGIELAGKTLGVIGLGSIGVKVANAAASSALKMNVIGCDPYLSIENAWNLSNKVKCAKGYDEIFKCSDFITLHIPMTKETQGIIGKDAFQKMKEGVRLINLSRAELVDSQALKEAILHSKVISYVTDFPANDTIGTQGIITIPHLGASTIESEENCAVYAVQELIDFLESGNIKNSVNFSNVSMKRKAGVRLCIIHRTVPTLLSKISSTIASKKINVLEMASAAKGNCVYTIIDLDADIISKEVLDSISSLDGVIRTRMISK